MRREKDRAPFAAKLPHRLLEHVARLGVQPDERLVEHDELRRMQKRREQRELLLHSVRVGRDGCADFLGRKGQRGGVLVDARLAVLLGDAEDVRDEVQILHPRHEVVEIGVVGHVGDVSLHLEGIVEYRNAVPPRTERALPYHYNTPALSVSISPLLNHATIAWLSLYKKSPASIDAEP